MEYKGLIVINQDYLDYLHYYDFRVSNNHEEGKERPNLNVLVDDEGNLWALPITSQTKYGDLKIILNNAGGKKPTILVNNMIPIVEGTFKNIYTTDANKNDYLYLNLLDKEDQEIKSIFKDKIVPKIDRCFKEQHKQKTIKNGYTQMFMNYDLLLEKSKNWEFVHNKHNEIINKFTNENVSLLLDDLDNLNQDIIKLGKKDFVKVYEYSNVLKENHYEFDVIKKYIQQENVSIFLQKQNNVKDIKIKSFSDYKQEIAIQRKEEKMLKENIIRRQEKVPRLKNIFLDKNNSNLVNILDNKETIKETNKTSAKTIKKQYYEREK